MNGESMPPSEALTCARFQAESLVRHELHNSDWRFGHLFFGHVYLPSKPDMPPHTFARQRPMALLDRMFSLVPNPSFAFQLFSSGIF